MSILSGIHDGEYLAQFLGKRIAIQDTDNKNKYYLYPELYAIYSDGMVHTKDKDGRIFIFPWSQCENPYIVFLDKEIEIK